MKKHPITGPEVGEPLRSEMRALANALRKDPDVFSVLGLLPIDGGRYLYYVRTTFPTWPRYVIGETRPDLSETKLLFRSGEEWTAQDAWKDYSMDSPLIEEGEDLEDAR